MPSDKRPTDADAPFLVIDGLSKGWAEGWKARGKRLLHWVNNKEEDEQQ